MDKGITFYIHYHIKRRYIDSWEKAVDNLLDNISTEANFICAYLDKDQNDSCHYTLFERWNEESVESFIKNQIEKKEYRIRFQTMLNEWSQYPCSYLNLKPVDERHKCEPSK
ncbi:MAG: hypothetical protein N4A49_02625 [Marinifilaceae bacterium]|jgi:sulfatase maturation enzyme AslB (radical SAM superfamily)|nr:hypothetical protein [Marinifilaceae bacterium]